MKIKRWRVSPSKGAWFWPPNMTRTFILHSSAQRYSREMEEYTFPNIIWKVEPL
jgi:hypothetical protein